MIRSIPCCSSWSRSGLGIERTGASASLLSSDTSCRAIWRTTALNSSTAATRLLAFFSTSRHFATTSAGLGELLKNNQFIFVIKNVKNKPWVNEYLTLMKPWLWCDGWSETDELWLMWKQGKLFNTWTFVTLWKIALFLIISKKMSQHWLRYEYFIPAFFKMRKLLGFLANWMSHQNVMCISE